MRHYIVALAFAIALAVPAVAMAAPLVVTDKGDLDVMTWLIAREGEWTRERLADAEIPLESKERITALLDSHETKLATRKRTSAVVLPLPPTQAAADDHEFVIAQTARAKGFSEEEVSILLWIHHKESCNPAAVSASGKYFGAFQLSASKVQGVAWWDPAVNTSIAIDYIRARYGTVAAAQQHWLANHWY